MLSGSKNKSKTVEDESIRDKSKFVVVGFVVMVIALIGFIVGEIYTSLKLSEQNKLLSSSGNIQQQTDDIVIEIAKLGKDVNSAEYSYIQEIMKFMSPTEFQNYKNSISGMANQFNVQINSLNESESLKLGKLYAINYIEYQFLSTFENLTFLKNKLSETKFKINIVNETIKRENPNSNKIIAQGRIGVYVFPGKEKLLKEKKSIIEQFEKQKNKENEKDSEAKSDEKN